MESAASIDYALQNHNDHHHLGTRINIATRSAHTKLNKGLILRLPLALPPIAPTPSVYVSGLLHVAPIYIAFESFWRDIVESTPKEDDEEDGTSNLDSPDHVSPGSRDQDSGKDNGPSRASERIHSTLKFLHLPELQRSERLRDDIRSITGWAEDVVDKQISLASKRGDLGKFISHINRSVEQHPHVLLAYAWVLYMALFAGGRFIRGSLENAGAEFWVATSEPVYPSMVPCEKPTPSSPVTPQFTSPGGYEGDDELSAVSAPRETVTTTAATTTITTSKSEPSFARNTSPLQFFRFDTPQDGEDLKIVFKRRLIDSESRLTTDELEDIVHEATRIFDHMNSLVTQLDIIFSKSPFSAERNGGSPITPSSGSPSYVRSIGSSLESWARLLIPGGGGGPRSRLQDSVAIAKERGVRALSKSNRSSAGSSVTSSEWGGDRNWSNASGSVASIGSGAGAGVSSLQAKGTLTSSAELIDKTGILSSSKHVSSTSLASQALPHQQGTDPQESGEASGGGIARSKSVRFGKDVASPSKKPAGIVRSKSVRKRVVNPTDDTFRGEHETSSSRNGFDGVDECESESEGHESEKKSSPYGVCPIVGVAKGEKHVRFLMTPAQEEDELRRKAASGGSTGSSATVTVLRNGLVVLGLVGVVLGVGRFRV